MKKIIGILVLVGIAGIVVIQLSRNKEISKNRIYQYNKNLSVNVLAQKIGAQQNVAEQEFTGTFNPNKEVKLNSDVQGKITAIYVNEGDQVRKGQALVKLDASLLNLQLKSIDIQISGLETDVERYTTLVNSGAIEGVKLEKTELGLRTALAKR